MSQALTPTSGGVVAPTTTLGGTVSRVVSQVYIEVNNLQPRPTEWGPEGRPIYRRLPATSETYQVNFFNLIPTGNTAVAVEPREVGYVYIPWGESINGATSAEVVAADGNKTLLIKGGNLVWKYGKTSVVPTILDIGVLDVRSGKYDIAYELLYDDSPIPNTYAVSDYLLSGTPLDITASTDGVVGWRYPAVNAFLENTGKIWKNSDSYFSALAQPTDSFLQWESDYASSYTRVLIKAPSSTVLTGTATLFVVSNGVASQVATVDAETDGTDYYFDFSIAATLSTGWRVEFSDLDTAVAEIQVTGVITLLTPLAGPTPRASLVMYPAGTLPQTVLNAAGDETPATYARLAEVDIGPDFAVLSISDQRELIHRDYTPVADWLTDPFDSTLVHLYEQVDSYSTTWMSPQTALLQEYDSLETESVEVTQ